MTLPGGLSLPGQVVLTANGVDKVLKTSKSGQKPPQ